MGLIVLEGMKFNAFHGVHREEGIIGGDYMADVYLDYAFEKNEDLLEKTANYEIIYATVAKRMQTPVKLIEHLAELILADLGKHFPATPIRVRISKFSPPVGGELYRAFVEVTNEPLP
jgi:dihydroneopterin aldolase